MGTTQQILAVGRSAPATRPTRRAWRGGLQGSEFNWAIAFVLPYAAVFLLFVVYPVGYGLWLGSKPSLYAELASDPTYVGTVINTALYVGIGVNLKMFLAFLLSGFFMRRRWWIKALLMIYVLPWAIPALPAFISIHWMLNGQWGFLNNVLWALFGIDGPIWLNSHWLGLASNIASYIWKWMPFWTVIFLAGRMAIPQELYEAAEIDGATGYRRFAHVTVPLLANLYLVCTLLSTIWTLGDFTTVYFVSGGGPAMSTEVLATLGIREAFTVAEPRLGVAAVMSALPVLIPIVILLMRKLRTAQVQL
ncbi:MAG TPA: sugar ABC transporter permease [Acetobacteraceae bacterium]|nr:sugar ABC transporter permease [Acetobacteraceae bacterium]